MIGKKLRKLIGKRNGINIYSTLKSKSKLKSNKKINQMSNGKYKQTKEEQKLKKELMERCQGLCENCGKAPTEFPFTLDKHEKVFRSKGGNPLDPENCIMICRACHQKFHHLK